MTTDTGVVTSLVFDSRITSVAMAAETHNTDGMQAIADAITERMVELHLNVQQLAEIADVSPATARQAKNHGVLPRRAENVAAIGAALRWGVGWEQRLMAGEAPSVVELSSDAVSLEGLSMRDRAVVIALVATLKALR